MSSNSDSFSLLAKPEQQRRQSILVIVIASLFAALLLIFGAIIILRGFPKGKHYAKNVALVLAEEAYHKGEFVSAYQAITSLEACKDAGSAIKIFGEGVVQYPTLTVFAATDKGDVICQTIYRIEAGPAAAGQIDFSDSVFDKVFGTLDGKKRASVIQRVKLDLSAVRWEGELSKDINLGTIYLGMPAAFPYGHTLKFSDRTNSFPIFVQKVRNAINKSRQTILLSCGFCFMLMLFIAALGMAILKMVYREYQETAWKSEEAALSFWQFIFSFSAREKHCMENTMRQFASRQHLKTMEALRQEENETKKAHQKLMDAFANAISAQPADPKRIREKKIDGLCQQLRSITPGDKKSLMETEVTCRLALKTLPGDFKEARKILTEAITERKRKNKTITETGQQWPNPANPRLA